MAVENSEIRVGMVVRLQGAPGRWEIVKVMRKSKHGPRIRISLIDTADKAVSRLSTFEDFEARATEVAPPPASKGFKYLSELGKDTFQ